MAWSTQREAPAPARQSSHSPGALLCVLRTHIRSPMITVSKEIQ